MKKLEEFIQVKLNKSPLVLAALLIFLFSIPAFAGRFELIQLGQARADQYLLDTQTGKIWRSECAHAATNGNCDYEIWKPMDVVGISTTLEQVIKKIADKNRTSQGQ